MNSTFKFERLQRLARALVAVVAVFALLASTASPIFAAGGQFGSVSGTIVDQVTNKPVAGATVVLISASGKYTAKTNGNGYFSAIGLPVDTYVLSSEIEGYDPLSVPGITIQGDQNVALGTIHASKNLKVIGTVRSRDRSGAFQPSQTVDSYSIGQDRIQQTTGRAFSTNENNIVLAAPGVTLANSGVPVIRGGGATEVGYQLDGVSFTEPFLSGNASYGLVNGVGSVQVVEGAGDATQGNIGSGVINIIPKRGTFPSFANLDFESGGPNFSHQFSFEYGVATKNNSFSDYIAYNGQRYNPYNGYFNATAGPQGSFFGNQNVNNNQWVNNAIVRFGKNNNQSLQFLYENINQVALGNYGGGPANLGVYNPDTNPNGLAYYPYDSLSQGEYYFLTGYTPAQYAKLVGLDPYVPATNTLPNSPQVNSARQTEFLKFEYDNNLTPTTFLALRYYNWSSYDKADASFSLGPGSGGITQWSNIGGPTQGQSFDLTHQFGSTLTVTLNGKYDNVHPIWDGYEPQVGFFGLNQFTDATNSPNTADWLPGGYIYDYFHGDVPRVPIWGIGYNKSFFQNWGTGLRFQYVPTSALHIDLGVRYEGQNQHWFSQLDQYGLGLPAGYAGGPFGVGNVGLNGTDYSWNNTNLQPKVWEPRIGASYQLSPNDAIRAGYGRSAVFINAQTAGTPFQLYNLGQYLGIPAKPGATCPLFNGGSAPCTTYVQQLYWQGDSVEAPDAGNTLPAIYSNYDFTYTHQFKNGWGARAVGFYKEGTNLPSDGLITLLPGGGAIFGSENKGFNRTTGAEFGVTTPEKAVGVSGFFTATYQNVLGTTPPLAENETNVPLLPAASIELGNIYRAGYVSPFSFRTGATYKTASGFSVTPILQFNIGYPYSSGTLIASQCGNKANGQPNYVNIIQDNFGCGSPQINNGIYSTSGPAIATAYYDPAYSGTNFNPQLAATRGVRQTAASGGYLSSANLNAALTLQYKTGPNTLGIQFTNLFGNAFNGTVPAVNPYYQPVATGVSGPQTYTNANCVSPAAGGYGSARGCANIPASSAAFTNGAYILSNGNFTAGPSIAPLTPFSFNVFYQRAL
jgi:hypothetical protein